MKILIIQSYHFKNQEGLEKMLDYLKYEYSNGDEKDIENYDIILSPNKPIDTSKYPNKKFIFGPHFSVFPNTKLYEIKNTNNNAVYLQPSEWAAYSWINKGANSLIPIKIFPFPVNTIKFKPIPKNKRTKVYIYYKRRQPNELLFIQSFLKNKNIKFEVFDYLNKYPEKKYLKYLQKAKYGIILDAHESQGFAIEEALSCNVPLLVWNVTNMSQEYNSIYDKIPASSIPYWDNRCGEFFYDKNEFETRYNRFIKNLNKYKPREFILENLTMKKRATEFDSLIKTLKI
jgi:hypothetical protein